jgi:hypothetical protein
VGDILYASPTVAGGFTTTKPVAPNNIISVAAVLSSGANGILLVRPQIGSNINNDEGVKITTPTTGDLLQLQASGLWENKSVASLSLVPQSRTLTINGTAFDLSADRTWSIPVHDAVTLGTANGLSLSGQVLSLGLASGSINGALSSTDWTTFNNKIGGTIASDQVAFGTGAGVIGGDSGLTWDNVNKILQSRFRVNSETNLLGSGIWGADTVLAFNVNSVERWRITNLGILQSNGAQTIRTSTGNLTLATAAGNGNIILSHNGSGSFLMGGSTENRLVKNTFSVANILTENRPKVIYEGFGASNTSQRVFAQIYNNNDVYSPTHVLGKTRGTTNGSVNSVISGDSLGVISFQGANGTNMGEGAAITAFVDDTPSTTAMPTRLAFYTASSGNVVERWRITNLGILRSNGAQTIQTSTGNLTIATAGGNGNILLSPDGSGRVGIGTLSPISSAILDLSSTTRGFLPPRMTTTERNAIASPVAGLMIYNTTTNLINVYNGTIWI